MMSGLTFGMGPLIYCYGDDISIRFLDKFWIMDSFMLLRTNLAITALFAGTILWFAIPLLQRNWRQFTPVMEIRTFWPYLSVALGCALLLIFSLAMIALSFTGKAHRDGDDEPAGAA